MLFLNRKSQNNAFSPDLLDRLFDHKVKTRESLFFSEIVENQNPTRNERIIQSHSSPLEKRINHG